MAYDNRVSFLSLQQLVGLVLWPSACRINFLHTTTQLSRICLMYNLIRREGNGNVLSRKSYLKTRLSDAELRKWLGIERYILQWEVLNELKIKEISTSLSSMLSELGQNIIVSLEQIALWKKEIKQYVEINWDFGRTKYFQTSCQPLLRLNAFRNPQFRCLVILPPTTQYATYLGTHIP